MTADIWNERIFNTVNIHFVTSIVTFLHKTLHHSPTLGQSVLCDLNQNQIQNFW